MALTQLPGLFVMDGLAFSNLVFSWVLLLASPGVCSFWGLLQVLQFFFSYCLSIHLFCYDLFFSIFYSKIVLFLLPLVVNLSLFTLPQSIGRIFFHNFWIPHFIYIAWSCPGTFLVFCQYLLLYFFQLYCQTCQCLSFGCLFFCWVPVYFTFLSTFTCCHSFIICSSCLISHWDFVFLFVFLWGIPVLLMTSFTPVLINLFSSVMLSIGICCNILFTFSVSTLTFYLSWFLRDDNVAFCSYKIFFN